MTSALAAKHLRFHDAGKPVVAMAANWPDGSVMDWHSHPRAQLLYAIEGVMVVRSCEGYRVILPGRGLWLPAGVKHEVRFSGHVKIRTVFINSRMVQGLPTATCVISVPILLRELIMAAARVPPDDQESPLETSLMHLLIQELAGSHEEAPYLPIPSDERIHSIARTLVDQPDNTLSIEAWGEQLGVTGRTIRRLFLKETLMTFAQWRKQAKLLYALQCIAAGQKIFAIALDCGYSSPSAFTAMFRRHFGVPPSIFQQKGA